MNLIVYTREPEDDRVYAKRLAYSMHLALEEKGVITPLNHNSGVLFAKATENPDGSLNPKSLKLPFVIPVEGGEYAVFAVRTLADGEDDTEDPGLHLVYKTRDFIDYRFLGMTSLAFDFNVNSSFNFSSAQMAQARDFYKMTALVNREVPDAGFTMVSPVTISISADLGAYLKKKLLPACHVSTEFDPKIHAENLSDIDKYRAFAVYSDGSKVMKKVAWNESDLASIDFSKPGTYTINGQLTQPHFSFPLLENRADPCICRYNGKYYFVSTHDADHEHTMYARVADSIEGLATAEDHLILDAYTYDDIGGLLWAPEFHEIDGRLYIFHAATPEPFFCEESHVMVLREGGDPVNKADWSRPKRVTKADGSELAHAGEVITLDMTEFEWEGKLYAVWSQRQFLPKDLGAWLYIAELDRKDPWRLASEPVVLSKPDYGWANNHTFVDEGPFAITDHGKLLLTFSSAAVDSTYVVGLFTLEKGLDPLTVSNWKKKGYPLLTSRSAEGQFGTGHNAYVKDEDGIVYNTYHARPSLDGPRSTGIRRVHFDIDDEPMLDVTEDLDLREDFSAISVEVTVG